MDWGTGFAWVWNRTALGIGVLLGLYFAYRGWWLRSAIIFGIALPAYFWLHHYLDAP